MDFSNYTNEQLDEFIEQIYTIKLQRRTKKTSMTIKERYATDEAFREHCKQKALERYYNKIKPSKS